MILGGIDPDAVVLEQFLDAAYVCLVDSYQAAGMTFIDALEATAEYRAGTLRSDTSPTEEAVAKQNQDSLAELQRMMAGT